MADRGSFPPRAVRGSSDPAQAPSLCAGLPTPHRHRPKVSSAARRPPVGKNRRSQETRAERGRCFEGPRSGPMGVPTQSVGTRTDVLWHSRPRLCLGRKGRHFQIPPSRGRLGHHGSDRRRAAGLRRQREPSVATILVIDLGTTYFKFALFNRDGQLCHASPSRNWETSFRNPGDAGHRGSCLPWSRAWASGNRREGGTASWL